MYLGILIFTLWFLIFNFSSIKTPGVLAETSSNPDAIAIRVIPNPNFYSASRWYSEQGFTGSPQTIVVDDYEAVRDGRTVYVNVGNKPGMDLYTNIYLISYNQEAQSETLDIFSRLLSHWKFNTNKNDSDYCDIDINLEDVAGACIKDEDCPAGYACAGAVCKIPCLINSDCPSNDWCGSEKAKITRDTKRLADLAEMRLALNSYSGSYPKLGAGSYLTGKSVSVWPSWQETLASDLGLSILPVDPINKLGDCGDSSYDPVTCWDKQDKKFAFTDGGGNFTLGSNDKPVYWYDDGEFYVNLEGSYNNFGADPFINTSVINNPPEIKCGNLTGLPHEKFSGYISASDADGDSLSFSIVTSGEIWTGWSADPGLKDTAVPNQKEIYAAEAGDESNYDFIVTVDDGNGGQEVKNCTIKIKAGLPVVEAIQDQTLVVGQTLDFTIIAHEPSEQYPLSYSFSGLPAPNLSCSELVDGHNCHVQQIVEYPSASYPVTVAVADSQGDESIASFFLTITNSVPVIQVPSCDSGVVVGQPYAGCTYTAIDPEGHTISFGYTGVLPTELTFSGGIISGTPTETGNFTISITATDQYGAESNPVNFNLGVTPGFVCPGVAINSIENGSVYAYPPGALLPLYHGPIQFNVTASVSTPESVTFSLVNKPSWLSINVYTGQMQGTQTDNTNNVYNITVKAENDCGEYAEATFQLTVFPNEWCGDDSINGSESCDDGDKNTNTPCLPVCDDDCVYCDESCVSLTVTGDSCCTPYTCADYPGQCNSSLDNNCGDTIDCSNNCAAGESCVSNSCEPTVEIIFTGIEPPQTAVPPVSANSGQYCETMASGRHCVSIGCDPATGSDGRIIACEPAKTCTSGIGAVVPWTDSCDYAFPKCSAGTGHPSYIRCSY